MHANTDGRSVNLVAWCFTFFFGFISLLSRERAVLVLLVNNYEYLCSLKTQLPVVTPARLRKTTAVASWREFFGGSSVSCIQAVVWWWFWDRMGVLQFSNFGSTISDRHLFLTEVVLGGIPRPPTSRLLRRMAGVHVASPPHERVPYNVSPKSKKNSNPAKPQRSPQSPTAQESDHRGGAKGQDHTQASESQRVEGCTLTKRPDRFTEGPASGAHSVARVHTN